MKIYSKLLLAALVLATIGLLYSNRSKETSKEEVSDKVYITPEITGVPFDNSPNYVTKVDSSNRLLFVNRDQGYSFEFNHLFNLDSPVGGAFVSLISPPDPNRNPKVLSYNEYEMKVEIITDDSTEKCREDHSASDTNILEERETTVGGTKTILYSLEGYSTAEYVCVMNKNKRYKIAKYPLQTSYQEEFDHLLETFKFLE